jgi:hypothetical protein
MSPVHEKNFPRVYNDLLVSVQPVFCISARNGSKF